MPVITRVTFDKKTGKEISSEVIGSPDGIVHIPDDMLPIIANIFISHFERMRQEEMEKQKKEALQDS